MADIALRAEYLRASTGLFELADVQRLAQRLQAEGVWSGALLNPHGSRQLARTWPPPPAMSEVMGGEHMV